MPVNFKLSLMVLSCLFAMADKKRIIANFVLRDKLWEHRNIKTQGITTAETSVIKLDGFYWFR